MTQDAKEKRKNDKRCSSSRKNKRSNEKTDYLNILNQNMLREGGEQGGKYWDSVISDFDLSDSKGQFVTLWEKDSSKQMTLDYPDKKIRIKFTK